MPSHDGVGAGKLDRVHKGTKQGLLMAAGLSAAITVILLFLNKFLFGFFTDTPQLIHLAGRMMRIMAVGYVAVSITQVLGGVMRGCGDTVTPMASGLVELIMRVSAVLVLPLFLGQTGLYFAELCAWAGAAVLLMAVYYIRIRSLPKTDRA